MCFLMVQCMVKGNLNVPYKIFLLEHPHNNSLGGFLSKCEMFIIVGERWLFENNFHMAF